MAERNWVVRLHADPASIVRWAHKFRKADTFASAVTRALPGRDAFPQLVERLASEPVSAREAEEAFLRDAILRERLIGRLSALDDRALVRLAHETLGNISDRPEERIQMLQDVLRPQGIQTSDGALPEVPIEWTSGLTRLSTRAGDDGSVVDLQSVTPQQVDWVGHHVYEAQMALLAHASEPAPTRLAEIRTGFHDAFFTDEQANDFVGFAAGSGSKIFDVCGPNGTIQRREMRFHLEGYGSLHEPARLTLIDLPQQQV